MATLPFFLQPELLALTLPRYCLILVNIREYSSLSPVIRTRLLAILVLRQSDTGNQSRYDQRNKAEGR